MGRKSRLKRERAAELAVRVGHETRLADVPAPKHQAVAEPIAPEIPDGRGNVRRERGATTGTVGARVARVAVDDATWTAFRELCGATPASIRLGQLVAAEVERANSNAPESAALDALIAIRGHADRLEQLLRRPSPHGDPVPPTPERPSERGGEREHSVLVRPAGYGPGGRRTAIAPQLQRRVRRSSYFRLVAKKFREVRKALRAEGWKLVRQTGSHETWQSADGTRVVTVAGKDSDTVPVGTLAAIRRATGLRELR